MFTSTMPLYAQMPDKEYGGDKIAAREYFAAKRRGAADSSFACPDAARRE